MNVVATRNAYKGWQEGQLPPCPMGAGGVRIALHTEPILSLLSCEGIFFSVVDSLFQENFSGGMPPDSQRNKIVLSDQYIKHSPFR